MEAGFAPGIFNIMRYKEIKKRIHSHYESLPKNQKVIAEYIVDNFDRVPFLNVHDISEATNLSVASIVRFAQRIGFSGFQEMREEIGDTLQSHIQNHQIFSLVEQKQFKDDTLTSVANQDISNINNTLNSIDRKNFDEAIKEIIKADKVFTAGLGISYLLSQILTYQLTQVGINSQNFDHNFASFMEQVLYLTKKDVLILLSFPPYSKETIDTAIYAKSKKIKVVSISNKDAAPISRYSDINLAVNSENMLFTNSFAAISVLINALATECAIKNKSKAKKMLDDLNKIVKQQEMVIT